MWQISYFKRIWPVVYVKSVYLLRCYRKKETTVESPSVFAESMWRLVSNKLVSLTPHTYLSQFNGFWCCVPAVKCTHIKDVTLNIAHCMHLCVFDALFQLWHNDITKYGWPYTNFPHPNSGCKVMIFFFCFNFISFPERVIYATASKPSQLNA